MQHPIENDNSGVWKEMDTDGGKLKMVGAIFRDNQ